MILIRILVSTLLVFVATQQATASDHFYVADGHGSLYKVTIGPGLPTEKVGDFSFSYGYSIGIACTKDTLFAVAHRGELSVMDSERPGSVTSAKVSGIGSFKERPRVSPNGQYVYAQGLLGTNVPEEEVDFVPGRQGVIIDTSNHEIVAVVWGDEAVTQSEGSAAFTADSTGLLYWRTSPSSSEGIWRLDIASGSSAPYNLSVGELGGIGIRLEVTLSGSVLATIYENSETKVVEVSAEGYELLASGLGRSEAVAQLPNGDLVLYDGIKSFVLSVLERSTGNIIDKIQVGVTKGEDAQPLTRTNVQSKAPEGYPFHDVTISPKGRFVAFVYGPHKRHGFVYVLDRHSNTYYGPKAIEKGGLTNACFPKHSQTD